MNRSLLVLVVAALAAPVAPAAAVAGPVVRTCIQSVEFDFGAPVPAGAAIGTVTFQRHPVDCTDVYADGRILRWDDPNATVTLSSGWAGNCAAVVLLGAVNGTLYGGRVGTGATVGMGGGYRLRSDAFVTVPESDCDYRFVWGTWIRTYEIP